VRKALDEHRVSLGESRGDPRGAASSEGIEQDATRGHECADQMREQLNGLRRRVSVRVSHLGHEKEPVVPAQERLGNHEVARPPAVLGIEAGTLGCVRVETLVVDAASALAANAQRIDPLGLLGVGRVDVRKATLVEV
jgi:hypothetical protein